MISIPTLLSLYEDQVAALEAEFEDSLPPFGKVMLRALAAVQAAKFKIYYLAAASVQKNIFVDTADRESFGGTLERFGRIKLGRNPFPAKAGQYNVEVTGDLGAVIRAQTTFKSNDDASSPGKLFVLDVEKIMGDTTDMIVLRALEPGIESKLMPDDQLTSTAPIAGVNSTGVVLTQAVEPKAEEAIEDYRALALNAYRLEPQGGAGSDYKLWASDAQGVKTVYTYAISGEPNELNLFVEAVLADSIDGQGTPSDGLLLEVEAVVEQDPDDTKPDTERGRRPLGINQIHYLPVTVKQLDIDIAGFVGLTPEIEAQLLPAIREKVDLIRPFVSSVDILENKNDLLDPNVIIASILNARPGSIFGTISLSIDSVPVMSVLFENGDIPHLNSVTYS